MQSAWCISCNADVTAEHAMEGRPCPICSNTEYFVIGCNDDDILKATDERCELLMQRGEWDAAVAEYSSCPVMEPSETTLRMATLELRRDCAQYIAKTLNRPVALEDFMQDIKAHYDSFVTKWIMHNYQGIRLVPDGSTYNVIRRDNP